MSSGETRRSPLEVAASSLHALPDTAAVADRPLMQYVCTSHVRDIFALLKLQLLIRFASTIGLHAVATGTHVLTLTCATLCVQQVMAHYPGNTPKSWRRQFYGDIAHGVKYVHLYVFAPSTSSPANDYVDADGGIYEEVLRSTHELGEFDDIIAEGKTHAAGVKVIQVSCSVMKSILRAHIRNV